jgi:hypothetical protein
MLNIFVVVDKHRFRWYENQPHSCHASAPKRRNMASSLVLLLNSYGALEFQGYSCDENDARNCFIDVLYNATTCNTGDVAWNERQRVQWNEPQCVQPSL